MPITDHIMRLLPHGNKSEDMAQAVNLTFLVPVAMLVLLPIGLPLMILTWIVLLPFIPFIYMLAEDPQQTVMDIASTPVKALFGIIKSLITKGEIRFD